MIPSVAGAAATSRPGIIPGAAVDGFIASTLHQFTLTETSGGGSPGLFRIGLAFEAGDVSSSQILEAEIDGGSAITVNTINHVTHADGSLRYCVMVGDAGTFTAGQSKTINVAAATGTQSSSGITATTVLGALSDDFEVAITNHTGSADSVNVGDLTFSLQTAIGTSTRVFITDDVETYVRGYAWQQVSPDEHLICIWHFDMWLDSGSLTGLEVVPVLSQNWIVDDPFGTAQTKQERTYDAEFLEGATSLIAKTGLDHAYYCRGALIREDDDDQHAKPFWSDQGTAMPTLRTTYSAASQTKFARARMVPPYDLTRTYADTPLYNSTGSTGGSLPDTYGIFGLNGHRPTVNGAGGYIGRGWLGDGDGRAWTLQTAAAWRVARVMAHAGLSIYGNVRDHQTAGSDVSMGLRPLPLANVNGGTNSWTGLGAEGVSVFGSIVGSPSGTTIPEDNPVGGTGVFSGHDSAHAHNYSYFIAMTEGAGYMLDAVLSIADLNCRSGNWNNIGYNSRYFYFQLFDRGTAQSIPTTNHGATFDWNSQQRNWAPLAFGAALALVQDSDRHRPYIEAYAANNGEYLEDALTFYPASHLAYGGLYPTEANAKPAFDVFTSIALYHMANMTQNATAAAKLKATADFAIKPLINILKSGIEWIDNFSIGVAREEDDFVTWNDEADVFYPARVTIDAATDTITIVNPTVFVTGAEPVAGTPCYFAPRDPSNFNFIAQIPAEATITTTYFCQNVSGTFPTVSFQVSTDEAGSSIVDFTTDYTEAGLSNDQVVTCIRSSDNGTVNTTYPDATSVDNFAAITRAGLHVAWVDEHADIAAADMQKLEAFLTGVTNTVANERFSNFQYDSDYVRSYSS